MEEALVRILTPRRSIDILRDVHAAKEQRKPYVVVFVGVNGVGKSTNLAKVYLLSFSYIGTCIIGRAHFKLIVIGLLAICRLLTGCCSTRLVSRWLLVIHSVLELLSSCELMHADFRYETVFIEPLFTYFYGFYSHA